MKIRPLLLAMPLLVCFAGQAQSQFSFDIEMPGVDIGFDMARYPNLVLIPGSPVYYAPRLNANFFFYDGLYWIYRDDEWYSSTWYNGPWQSVTPQYVPLYLLRVPVRYYRQPPQYFRGWQAAAPPRWGQHWGRDWESQRSGWNKWERRSVPAAAPLPRYQNQYRGDTYPRALEQRQAIRAENYPYPPRDRMSRESTPQRGRQADPRQEPLRELPEIRQPNRQQMAPPRPQQGPPRQFGPPTQANDPPTGSHQPDEHTDRRVNENRGKGQSRDQR